MSGYTIPQYPLRCNIWHLGQDEEGGAWQRRGPNVTNYACQLSQPQALIVPPYFLNYTSFFIATFIIRFPLGTAISDGAFNKASSARGHGDEVAIPGGSFNVFGIVAAAVVGAGFPNEHYRCLAYPINPIDWTAF